jgi:hypothetical protein
MDDLNRIRQLSGIKEDTDEMSEIGNLLVLAFDGDPQFLTYKTKVIKLELGSSQHELQIDINSLNKLYQMPSVSIVTIYKDNAIVRLS